MLPVCVQPIGAIPTGNDTFYPLRLPKYLLLEWMYKWRLWECQITAAPLSADDPYGFSIDPNNLISPTTLSPPLQKRVCPFLVEMTGASASYVYQIDGNCAGPAPVDSSSFSGAAYPSVGGVYSTGAPEWIQETRVQASVEIDFSNILYDPVTFEYLPYIEINVRQELKVTDFNYIPPSPPDPGVCLPPSESTYLIQETNYGGGSDLTSVTIDGQSFALSMPIGAPVGGTAVGGINALTITPTTPF